MTKKKGCDGVPDNLVDDMKFFWSKKDKLQLIAFQNAHRGLRQRLTIAPPMTRKEAEKQMREALYRQVERTKAAALRIEGLRDLIKRMLAGEVAVPEKSRWILDPALWNFHDPEP